MIVVYNYDREYFADMRISKEFLKLAAEIGAYIDYDIYFSKESENNEDKKTLCKKIKQYLERYGLQKIGANGYIVVNPFEYVKFVSDYGYYVSKVLIHYGGGSVIRSGLLGRVKASLERESIGYIELGGVKPNPRSGLVYQGISLCRKEKVDFILAVGGGSTIDSAKAIAAGTVYDGEIPRQRRGQALKHSADFLFQ